MSTPLNVFPTLSQEDLKAASAVANSKHNDPHPLWQAIFGLARRVEELEQKLAEVTK